MRFSLIAVQPFLFASAMSSFAKLRTMLPYHRPSRARRGRAIDSMRAATGRRLPRYLLVGGRTAGWQSG